MRFLPIRAIKRIRLNSQQDRKQVDLIMANKLDSESQLRFAIERLDVIGPRNWRQKIDVETLDMPDGDHCVLGQLYGNYHRGLDTVFSRSRSLGSMTPGYLAFSSMFPERLWIREITGVRDYVI